MLWHSHNVFYVSPWQEKDQPEQPSYIKYSLDCKTSSGPSYCCLACLQIIREPIYSDHCPCPQFLLPSPCLSQENRKNCIQKSVLATSASGLLSVAHSISDLPSLLNLLALFAILKRIVSSWIHSLKATFLCSELQARLYPLYLLLNSLCCVE